MEKDQKLYSILVAEDNLINQKVLESLLLNWGFKISVVSNGLEVLDKLSNEFFDAIILDYQMPEMNGFETVRAIRTSFDSKVNSIPVLFLTSEIDPNAFSSLEEYGIKNILKKPVEPNYLFHTLNQILKKLNNPKRKTAAKVHYLKNITDGNKMLMAEIIGLFIEEMPLCIDKMKKLCLQEDWGGVRKIIHKIKSNYKIVGLDEYDLILRDFEIDLEREVHTETYLARIIAIEQITAQAIERLLLKKEKLLE